MTSRWISLSFLAACILLLTLPIILTYMAVGNFSFGRLFNLLLGTIALIGFSWGVIKILPLRLGLTIILIFLASIIFLRFTHWGLVIFSGAGFTSEFFLHLEWQSVVLAWQEYPLITWGGTIGTLILLSMGYQLGRRIILPSRTVALAIVPICTILLLIPQTVTPEHEFIQSLIRWHQPINFDLPKESLAQWRKFDLVETDVISKSELKVERPTQPPNIILLYLESVGIALVDHPNWPNLMPKLKKLSENESFVPNFYTSAYITVEGIVNSQCGTLFPFERGGDSLTSAEGLADQMVCLGDTLAAAGYHSTFLGGANMSYAGKGDFLRAHGYHNTKGGEHWATMGLHQRPGTWGVSDVDLFAQSHNELMELRSLDKPFNLTMLTIGTHLPGYSYTECEPYGDGNEDFLNALYCTDQLLSKWLQNLEADGQLQDTILVITSDHHIFPNPEMRRLFGDETLEDRRLPLIVLDPLQRTSPLNDGAAYDLAPTLLDLAGIEHNSPFALGRSLLREESKRDYFFKRYADVLPGVANRHSHGQCETLSESPLSIPLEPCKREELKRLLRTQIRDLSRATAALDCETPALTHVTLPATANEALAVSIAGRDQSRSFVLSPQRVEPDTPGLYLARIQRNSEVHDRTFYPQTSIVDMDELPAIETEDSAWLIAWIGAENDNLPSWLSRDKALHSTSTGAVWLGKTLDNHIEWLNAKPANIRDNKWFMDQDSCTVLFAQNE